MDTDMNDYIDIVDIEKKDKNYNEYSKRDKQDILNELNEKRLTSQRFDIVKKRRTANKQKYQFSEKEFYKFVHMNREYYLDINDVEKISSRPMVMALYYRVFGELKKRDFLIKTQIHSDKFFISDDILRVYFKAYALERERAIT